VRMGSFLPAIRTSEQARVALGTLSSHGTCLSRALAVAARTPSADVAIAVATDPRAPLFAHAWIEMDGAPIDPSDAVGSVIARLKGSGVARSRAQHA
jgi:hypothetical protein